jgi:hypothetical protein
MSKKILIASDGDVIAHPSIPTAVSNLSIFNEQYTKPILKKIEKFKDDSDLSRLPTLEEIIEKNYDPENPPKPTESFDCRVKDIHIFSSEKSEYDPDTESNGYDRPFEQGKATPEKIKFHVDMLRKPDAYGKPNKGFVGGDCNTLTARIRVSKKGDTYEFTVMKTAGSGRFVKLKITKRGGPIELPFKIYFHSIDEDVQIMNAVEAAQHHTDAQERMSQNEDQKFASAIVAKLPEAIYCRDFLFECGLDYKGHMNAKRKNNIQDLWPSVTSISAINLGEGKGLFSIKKKDAAGRHFAELGFRTSKKVAQEITEEKEIPTTAAFLLSSMYHSYCQLHSHTAKDSNKVPEFTEPMMEEFLCEYCEMKVQNAKDRNKKKLTNFSNFTKKKGKEETFSLKSLSLSTGIKSLEYIACLHFWEDTGDGPLIKVWWMNKNNKDRGFSIESQGTQNFLRKVSDEALRNDMKRRMT